MRRKTPPSDPPSSPPKRRRTNPVQNWHTHNTELWAHAEWFVSLIDAPFFAFSEFQQIMTDMNLIMLQAHATRLQLARVRAAMCNAIPGGFAQPRRLSAAFLAAEVEELAMYRADARRILRGLDLLPANDPTTTTELPPHWWTRYRCPPPQVPPRGTPVYVRTTFPPPISPATRPLTTSNHPSSHVNANHPNNPISSALHLQKRCDALPKALTAAAACPPNAVRRRVYIRPGTFMSFEGDASIIIRYTDNMCEHTASDLDVMLVHPLQPGTPAASNPPTVDHSPLSSRMGCSPQQFFDPLSMETPRIVSDAPSALAYLYSSPRPIMPSPTRSITLRPHSPGTVECDVNVRQLAESMRLLDRKNETLLNLSKLNDTAEALHASVASPHLAQQYDILARELTIIADDLRVVLGPELPLTPVPRAPVVSTALNFSSPEPRRIRTDAAGPPSNDRTPDEKAIGNTHGGLAGVNRMDGVGVCEGAMPMGRMQDDGRGLMVAPNARIDFKTEGAIAVLAKALTRDALTSLPKGSALKEAPAGMRAEIMDCISSCVCVLIRARSTQNYDSIEKVVGAVTPRFGRNSEALEAIHTAARAFESTSTDSI